VLELRAINLYDRARVSKEDFRGRFPQCGFSGAGRPRTEDCPPGVPANSARAKHLEHVHKGLHAFFLSHDLGTQGRMKIARVVATDARIQLLADGDLIALTFLASNLPKTQCASQPAQP